MLYNIISIKLQFAIKYNFTLAYKEIIFVNHIIISCKEAV